MISQPVEQVHKRAAYWVNVLQRGEVIPGKSTVGGGSLPEEEMDTWLMALDVRHPDRFLAKLREMNPPIIARVKADRIVLDPRTVLAEQEDALLVGLQNALPVK
jgi:L-seryl-tRNA(Ser) seleniumtransferase